MDMDRRLAAEHGDRQVTVAGDDVLTSDTQDVHPEAAMRVADVIRLPENIGLSQSSIRAAIAAGSIRHERLGRRIVVTPAAVREWRKSCQNPVVQGSGSSQPNTQKTENSERMPSGASKTDRSDASLDALNKTLQALKKR
jgi:hypothetical protein